MGSNAFCKKQPTFCFFKTSFSNKCKKKKKCSKVTMTVALYTFAQQAIPVEQHLRTNIIFRRQQTFFINSWMTVKHQLFFHVETTEFGICHLMEEWNSRKMVLRNEIFIRSVIGLLLVKCQHSQLDLKVIFPLFEHVVAFYLNWTSLKN